MRNCKEERKETCGGREERLRNVIGREREITLSCGEQVMPCQEHGVWLFGFHEERIDEDAFADGSAADKRERRASPSDERELTKSVLVMAMLKRNRKNKKWVLTKWLGLAI